jgi:NADH:ubiquinone oxidoreductase subunit 6 (subunit J)
MFKYDALVYIGLLAVVGIIVVAALVVKSTPEAADFETRKIRFAAATFTGILMLLLFTAILYFVDATGPGKEIFEKVFTGLSPIGRGIIGYFFSAKK